MGTHLFVISQGEICLSDPEGTSCDQANPLTILIYRHLQWFTWLAAMHAYIVLFQLLLVRGFLKEVDSAMWQCHCRCFHFYIVEMVAPSCFISAVPLDTSSILWKPSWSLKPSLVKPEHLSQAELLFANSDNSITVHRDNDIRVSSWSQNFTDWRNMFPKMINRMSC